MKRQEGAGRKKDRSQKAMRKLRSEMYNDYAFVKTYQFGHFKYV